jgi:hypothetical protein
VLTPWNVGAAIYLGRLVREMVVDTIHSTARVNRDIQARLCAARHRLVDCFAWL